MLYSRLLATLLGVISVVLSQDIKWNQVQTLGSHNSYHLLPPKLLPSWNYSHPALSEQLDYGLRQFELDINANFEVYHLQNYDQNTNCASLSDCLSGIATWSATNPNHPLILVMLELKGSFNTSHFDELDTIIHTALGNILITPDQVRGTYSTLRDSIAADGWPTINSTRGRVLTALLGVQPTYVSDSHVSLANRTSFILYQTNSTDGDAVFFSFDDSTDPLVTEMVSSGYMVRTRADSDYNRGDPTRSTDEVQYDYFSVIDANNNTLVSKTEVVNFLAANGYVVSTAQISQLFLLCTMNPSAVEITFAQFQCAAAAASSAGVPFIPESPTTASEIAARDAALASGAQYISTDWYTCSDEYSVELPGGYTYRCNPVTMPTGCQNSHIENVKVNSCGGGSTTGSTSGEGTTSTTGTTGTTGSNASTTSQQSSAEKLVYSTIVVVLLALLAL